MMENNTTNQHGGQRPGAGPKKKPYRTRAVMVPEPIIDQVKALIKKFKTFNVPFTDADLPV